MPNFTFTELKASFVDLKTQDGSLWLDMEMLNERGFREGTVHAWQGSDGFWKVSWYLIGDDFNHEFGVQPDHLMLALERAKRNMIKAAAPQLELDLAA